MEYVRDFLRGFAVVMATRLEEYSLELIDIQITRDESVLYVRMEDVPYQIVGIVQNPITKQTVHFSTRLTGNLEHPSPSAIHDEIEKIIGKLADEFYGAKNP